MITGFSSSEQSLLLPQNGGESQWSQAFSDIWVPRTKHSVQHQLSQSHQDQTAFEEAHPDQPASTDREGWERYWAERGWKWRREPEITLARQEELAQRRAIPVDIKQGIYPFGGMTLTRADIEWLLATHDGRRGPIDWNAPLRNEREGLDLRGAVVSDNANLEFLPLARLRGYLLPEETHGLTEKLCAHALLYLKEKLFRLDLMRLNG